MTDADDLLLFATNFQQQVLSAAEIEGEEAFHAESFTREMIAVLTDAGEIDGGDACYHYARGVEISGYSVSVDELSLAAMVSIFTQSLPPSTVGKADVDTAIRRLSGYLDRALRGYHAELEEASPQYDMTLRIHEMRGQLSSLRLLVLTDGVVAHEPPERMEIAGLPAWVSVWDIRRTFRCVTSGQHREPIEIDFDRDFGGSIPCLAADDDDNDYSAFLAILPGEVLADVYGRYGARLLELNVRSFLQAKGKVNQGIRSTILGEPHRFLAYNNGISATASGLDLTPGPGGLAITRVRDFQIVNGGQTTASLFHAARGRPPADLSRVSVQAKITVVAPDRLVEVVPLISRFANSQNKVNEADFYANDAYHVGLEKLSRSVWAPAARGSQHQTRWFYERARGQYQDALQREVTDARRRQWKALHPLNQKFTKTDLAKFENTWELLPHIVSTGAEKNFREFAKRIKDRDAQPPTQRQFEEVAARAIVLRRAEQIVSRQALGGYRANIVTYSVARVLHATAGRIDLGRIWREQDISAALEEAIRRAALAIHPILTNPPNARNITEWCKRPECWAAVRDVSIPLPSALGDELLQVGRPSEAAGDDGLSDADRQNVARVGSLHPDVWLRLSRWAAETRSLSGWQRQIAYTLGRQGRQGRSASAEQARQGIQILEEAMELGFAVDDRDRASA